MIRIGDVVSDIETEAYYDGKIKKINISQYKNKWLIILFYPADFTFVCPTELEEAADYHDKFAKEGAEIMSVSTDTAFVHKAWHDNSPSIKKIKFPMLADVTGKMCKTFGTYLDKEGLSVRATFIINPKGEVKSIEMHDNSIGRNIKEIFRKFQAAKFVSEHDGLVCPASWTPGAKTLKPGEGLIGKI